jgi:RimJ/RimL family protein N-acetyltransferase
VTRESDDADRHFEIQRAASLAAFAHIYGDEPFPDEAVREQWRRFPGTVLAVEREGEVVGVAGIDGDRLAGFYVLPGWWGTGVAEELHAAALERGARKLWCLEENRRARRFYEKRGWRANGETRIVPFPPHPIDVGYSRSA